MGELRDVFDCDDAVVTSFESSWVPVFFAGDYEAATRYCSILDEMNIPALTGEDSAGEGCRPGGRLGLPILVPVSSHERASEVIASLDTALDHAPDDDEDEDLFDDDDEDDDFYPDDDDDFDDDEDEDDDEDDDYLDDDDDYDDEA